MRDAPIRSFDRSRLDAQKLGGALTTPGIILIDNAIDPGFVSRVYAVSRQVFWLSPETLERYRVPDGHVGYTPAGVERVIGNAADPARHFWNITDPNRTANYFPDEVPAFSSVMCELFRIVEEFAEELLRHCGEYLGKPSGYFEERAVGGDHLLRVNHYPVTTISGNDGSPLRFPAHRDFGLLTLYLGGAEPGLEVKIGDEWYWAWGPRGSIIVACGNVMRMESGGRFPAIRHRVRVMPLERHSVAFFTEPRPEVVLPNGERAGDYLARLTAEIRNPSR